jgi:signal transduction histidine kinase
MMTIVSENARRLNNLVSELLEVSRIEYGTFKIMAENFLILDVIRRTVAAVEPTAAEKPVTIEVEPPPTNLPAAFGDPLRVSEVVTNLLTNAIKYNHNGGHVTIRISEEDNELRVSVMDDGFGLAVEDIPKLFNRFMRIETDETRKVAGTGLGLFIVKQVVERMGGHVWATSAGPGQGSTFTFSLPKATGTGAKTKKVVH